MATYAVMAPLLDERARRLWAAAESVAIGYGGDALVSAATGLARQTIANGRRELVDGVSVTSRIRRVGAGRPGIAEAQPGVATALNALVEPLTRGDPTSPLRWTCKSRATLAAGLAAQGWRVSSSTVGRLLHALGYSLQALQKRREGTAHPDRHAQFEHINGTAALFLQDGQPVISVDTKKKELVGDFKNAGQEWQPVGAPDVVRVHACPGDAVGKAIPYGVYDMARNEAWVSVGRDHDTPAFAVASIRQWWTMMGRPAYPRATALYITGRCGRQQGLPVAGVEARPAMPRERTRPAHSRVARPARDQQVEHERAPAVLSHHPELAGTTTPYLRDGGRLDRSHAHCRGLRVTATLDTGRDATGITITAEEMRGLALHPHVFHGDWNYELRPHAT